jgi:hypothetical protein
MDLALHPSPKYNSVRAQSRAHQSAPFATISCNSALSLSDKSRPTFLIFIPCICLVLTPLVLRKQFLRSAYLDAARKIETDGPPFVLEGKKIVGMQSKR